MIVVETVSIDTLGSAEEGVVETMNGPCLGGSVTVVIV